MTIAADSRPTTRTANRGRLASSFDRDARQGLQWIAIPSVAALIGLGFPIALLFIYSFWTQDYLTINTTLTLKNYIEIVSQPLYGDLLLRSLLMAAAATISTVLLAYPIAYYIAFHGGRHVALWMFLITLPFWTSYLLRVFAWKVILGFNGVINSGLMAIGVISAPLEFLLYNPFAVVLTLAHAFAPFAILPILVSLQKIEPALLEAATDLGDGAWARFRRVTLPLSIPGVLSAAMIVFIPTVGDFVTPTLVGGNSGYMIANSIQNQFLKANNWPLGAALAITAMIAATIVSLAIVGLSRLAGRRS